MTSKERKKTEAKIMSIAAEKRIKLPALHPLSDWQAKRLLKELKEAK
jgi:hypothetical protein